MAGIINYADVFAATAEQIWDRAEVPDQNAYLAVCKRKRPMMQTEGKAPRVNDELTAVPWHKGSRTRQTAKVTDFRWYSHKMEVTVGLDVDEQKDLASIGVVIDSMTAMGEARRKFDNVGVFGFLQAALTSNTYTYEAHGKSWDWSTVAYNGQRLFSNSHPYAGGTDDNIDSGGGGQYWFLLDSAKVEPVLFGAFKEWEFYEFEGRERETGEREWGMDGRYAFAAGDPRSIFASNQTLNATNLEAAMIAMTEFHADDGTAGGYTPDLLLVGNSNLVNAQEVLKPINDAGATNVFNAMALRAQHTRWLP